MHVSSVYYCPACYFAAKDTDTVRVGAYRMHGDVTCSSVWIGLTAAERSRRVREVRGLQDPAGWRPTAGLAGRYYARRPGHTVLHFVTIEEVSGTLTVVGGSRDVSVHPGRYLYFRRLTL